MNLILVPLMPPESAPSPADSTVTSSTAPRRTGAVAKKDVPPLLNPFDALLMPSTVTFIDPPGILLKRGSPVSDCVAPGTSRATLSADRLRIGSWLISWKPLESDERFDVVSKIGDALASTVTLCDCCPT